MEFDMCRKIRGFYPINMLTTSATKFAYFRFPIWTAEHDRFVKRNCIYLNGVGESKRSVPKANRLIKTCWLNEEKSILLIRWDKKEEEMMVCGGDSSTEQDATEREDERVLLRLRREGSGSFDGGVECGTGSGQSAANCHQWRARGSIRPSSTGSGTDTR